MIILYVDGQIKEDATENQNECNYCVHNPKTCNADSPEETRKYGGQFCDKMKCMYREDVEDDN